MIEMRLNRVFSDLDEREYIDGRVPLRVGFVPLCGSQVPLNEKGIVVRCPMCGIVMVTWKDEYEHDWVMCPECGILG